VDIRKSKTHTNERFADQHRFEHWYRDNQVYFITATVRDHAHAFATEEAKHVFWTQWEKYTKEFEYTSWVTSLMNNHYHDLGYNKHADNLPVMMQRIHGSVAKLTNGLLDVRIAPFWIDHGKQNYFDGCIRDVLQCERAYRYTYLQSVRHRICSDPSQYPHTRVRIDLAVGIKRAVKLKAFLEGVPYARYDRRRQRRPHAG